MSCLCRNCFSHFMLKPNKRKLANNNEKALETFNKLRFNDTLWVRRLFIRLKYSVLLWSSCSVTAHVEECVCCKPQGTGTWGVMKSARVCPPHWVWFGVVLVGVDHYGFSFGKQAQTGRQRADETLQVRPRNQQNQLSWVSAAATAARRAKVHSVCVWVS